MLLSERRRVLGAAAKTDTWYTLVDRVEDIEPAVSKLRATGQGTAATPLAVDCEGETLSRRGKLSLLTVGTEDHVFIFDILKLGGKEAFKAGAGLRELLEDTDQQKIMFDCREDSDCLWHNHGVKLASVLDLQLLQVVHRENTRTAFEKMRMKPDFQPMLTGLAKCLEQYVHDPQMNRAKAAGKVRLSLDASVFMKRPLDDVLLAYAAVDIRGASALYRRLWAAVASPVDRLNVMMGSIRYLAFHRDKVVRRFDKYERHPFLPWGVLKLPAYRHETDLAGHDLEECQGCKRNLPTSIMNSWGIAKCPTCRKVDARY